MTAPTLSILMLSWNTRELTLDALRTIYEHPPAAPFEVVVVDNASQDGSTDAIAGRFPQVVLVRHPTNSGYGPGNNIAFRHATGGTALLLGSDTRVESGTLDTLLSTLSEHPEAGAVTCRVEGPTGYPEGTCLDFPTLRDGVALYLSLPHFAKHLPSEKFDFDRQQEVQQVSGTCLLLRRHLIERIGLFDEGYKILYTDVELCQRIHDAGQAILYTPATSLVHLGSQSCIQATGRLRAQMYEDILRYYVSRFGRRGAVVMLPILLARLAAVNRGRQTWRLLRPGRLLRVPQPQFGGTMSVARP
jgi:GT2 family glycosyltransferase